MRKDNQLTQEAITKNAQLRVQNQIWLELEAAALLMQKVRLSALFAADPNRVNNFSLTVDQLYLDYSKNFLTKEIMKQLYYLAQSCNVTSAIKQLMSGEIVNKTENRPALHTALRQSSVSSLIGNKEIMLEIEAEKEKMFHIVRQLQQGQWLGATGKAITHVVNLGIGGSDLGPMMALEALKSYEQSTLKIHFVSNVDPIAIYSKLAELDPATTLFIVSSKSFTTIETLTNAQVAKKWLQDNLKTKISNHFIAVTANRAKAQQFEIAPNNILSFWEWIGGRYSIWSTIGLPLALSIGVAQFEEFLMGARMMDAHFLEAPISENMPIILALIGIWYINFWNANTLAVLPYSENLRLFPAYLQQLDMESNGKSVQHTGKSVGYATGPILWGQAGTNGQHAFYQLLHQGTHFIPIDFIVASKGNTQATAQHQLLVANCLAQAQGLMQGSENESIKLAHEQMPGNKPSNMLLLNKITPRALGELLALYEHKVFVQGVIWQINSFDQPGVELGKKLANTVIQSLESGTVDPRIDPSTNALIQKIRVV